MDLSNYSKWSLSVIAVTNVSKIHEIIEIPVAIKCIEKIGISRRKNVKA